MKTLPIPETEQINAILNGSMYDLACSYVEKPSPYNLKEYLTITRQKLIDFLVSNPEKAETYFQKHKENKSTHDTEKIWSEGEEYVTAWFDHGHPHTIRRFNSLAEAVAEHVLVNYGMY